MYRELKEDTTHGTKEYPYSQYYMHKVGRILQVPVHWHEEMEIIYIRQDALYLKINGQDYTGKEGDFFFVNPGELHMMETMTAETKYYTLLFPLTFLSFQTADTLEMELLLPLREGQLLFPSCGSTLACAIRLRTLLDHVIAVNSAWKKGDSLHPNPESLCLQISTRMFLLQMVQALLAENALIQSDAGSSADMPKELLAYIREHYTEKLSLDTLSDEFHLSSKYISRYFKQHFSLSFTEYLMHLRISRAKKLLETTDCTVTEVALQSGFSSISYFIRSFRKACGYSPLQYRKAYQANSGVDR